MKALPQPETINEVDYPLQLIKKITPYLNDVTYTKKTTKDPNKKYKPNDKQRGYAWYYVHNGGIKADAYRRAYYSDYHKGRHKLIPDKDLKYNTIATGGYLTYRMLHVQAMIRLIRDEIENKIKADIPQTILEQLQIQASYDPSMFINANGTPAFKTWEEIPVEYRCCVEGISTTRYGKTGALVETTIKLVNRAVARKELLQIAPDLLQPSKLEILHTTLDSSGNETGLNYSKLSDSDLMAILKQSGAK